MPPRKAARAAAPDGASDPKRVDLLGRQDRTEATLTLLSPQAAHTGVCVEPAVFDFHPGTVKVPVECMHRLRPEVVQEFASSIAARSALPCGPVLIERRYVRDVAVDLKDDSWTSFAARPSGDGCVILDVISRRRTGWRRIHLTVKGDAP
jgi:hypothetical protein